MPFRVTSAIILYVYVSLLSYLLPGNVIAKSRSEILPMKEFGGKVLSRIITPENKAFLVDDMYSKSSKIANIVYEQNNTLSKRMFCVYTDNTLDKILIYAGKTDRDDALRDILDFKAGHNKPSWIRFSKDNNKWFGTIEDYLAILNGFVQKIRTA